MPLRNSARSMSKIRPDSQPPKAMPSTVAIRTSPMRVPACRGGSNWRMRTAYIGTIPPWNNHSAIATMGAASLALPAIALVAVVVAEDAVGGGVNLPVEGPKAVHRHVGWLAPAREQAREPGRQRQ